MPEKTAAVFSLSGMGRPQVSPPSVERETTISARLSSSASWPSLMFEKRIQVTYTVSAHGLSGFVSAAMLGLSSEMLRELLATFEIVG